MFTTFRAKDAFAYSSMYMCVFEHVYACFQTCVRMAEYMYAP